MKQQLVYLFRFFVLTVAIFMAAKWCFMIAHGDNTFQGADLLLVAWHGLSLDLSTALYFLILPVLMTIAASVVPLPSWLFRAYYLLVAMLLSLAFIADMSLYSFWRFKLDASCLQYLETPSEAFASVSIGYLVARVVAWALLSWGLYATYVRLAKLPPMKVARWWHGGVHLMLAAVMVVGIRGGLGESTTNIGQVYFSQNQFLNHAAVNPVFSFLSSLGKSGDYLVSYDYFTDEECRSLTNAIFTTESVAPDTLLNTAKPNIVIIIMESCGGQFTDMGGHPEITPRLNALRREGIDFTQCYANSWRTDKAVVSILSGYPAFPITSVMKVPEKSRKLPSIAASLQDAGYSTSFFYGGDINFTNMRSYVMGSGYERLCWRADFSLQEQQSAQWGVRDDLMFNALLSDIRQEKSEPWMKTLLTLSSHEPWDVPTHDLDDEVYNAFHYLDACIGHFIDELQQLPQWRNTVVILLPDHGYRYLGIDERTRLYNHIPMVWVGGAVKEARQIERICNQSDLAATLLGQLGIAHHDFTFSRDILSQKETQQVAWHTYNNGVSVFTPTEFMAYDLDVNQIVAAEGASATELLPLAKGLLQLTSHDLIAK